jgi:hypothetical protein
MLPTTGNTWERLVIALRVIPILATGRHPASDQLFDAGWLVGHGARASAIGTVVGRVASDGDELHVRVLEIDAEADHTGDGKRKHVADNSIDREAVLLESLAGQISMMNNPLIVTCGGRRMDLPFVRYRCLAKGIALNALHLSLGNRLNYYDRYDQNWHLDVCDLLCGQGASSLLTLQDLCALCGVDGVQRRTIPDDRARGEAISVFAIFLSVLRVMGRLSAVEHGRAVAGLSEAANIAGFGPNLGASQSVAKRVSSSPP